MIFTTQAIATHVEMQFPAHYCHFREFQESPDYRLYWDKCMEAVRDRELLSHIIFCNDLLRIPPIKTFLLYYEQDLIRITGREDAALELFVKKAIGAFWGMVFKFTLGYQDQESVSVSLNQRFCPYGYLFQKSSGAGRTGGISKGSFTSGSMPPVPAGAERTSDPSGGVSRNSRPWKRGLPRQKNDRI